MTLQTLKDLSNEEALTRQFFALVLILIPVLTFLLWFFHLPGTPLNICVLTIGKECWQIKQNSWLWRKASGAALTAGREQGHCYTGCASQCALFCFGGGALTLCLSSVDCVALCEVNFHHFFPWVDAFESRLAKLLSTLQVKATCAPPTNPCGGWTTQRTPTQTGLWSAGPARPAPSHLSPLQRVSTCVKPKTSSSPSWSQSSGVASNPARR